jgi:hypothetical protein
MMIPQMVDFDKSLVVAPRPLPDLWFGFAAKIEISFAYRLIQDVERQDEYTDLDGGTQRLKNHWSFALVKTSQ